MKDNCVSCGNETPYDVTENIHNRFHYVEGSGQLCEECYIRINDFIIT
jgi:hypothetical protein